MYDRRTLSHVENIHHSAHLSSGNHKRYFVKKAIFFHAFPDWGGLILLSIFTTERVRRMVQRTAKGKNMET